MDSSRTLVTGFGPFLDVADNPSAKLARMCGRPFEVLEVAFDAVDEWIRRVDPDSFDRLLMLGVAASRKTLSPEIFARNHIGSGEDVRGRRRGPLIEGAADLLLQGTLWTEDEIAEFELHSPIKASFDAGSYLCNYIYFRALRQFPTKKVGFLHVPSEEAIPLSEQSRLLSLVLAWIERD